MELEVGKEEKHYYILMLRKDSSHVNEIIYASPDFGRNAKDGPCLVTVITRERNDCH